MRQEQPPTHLALGICISLLAYIFFVTASSLVFSTEAKFPAIQLIFLQNSVSLLCILPLSLRKGMEQLKTSAWPIHLLRDSAGVLSYFLYFLAIGYLNLTDATMLNYTAPFFVPLVWWIWMREKIDLHVWWSIIIGFIGISLVLNPTKEIFEEGFFFGLGAGIVSSIAFAALRVLNLKKEPMSRTLFYYFLFGSLASAPFAWNSWVTPVGKDWFALLGVGLATVIAQMLLTIAYRYGTASYLSPLGYSTVIYAGISSWLLFDISPSFRSFLGATFIVLGGTLTYLLKKKPVFQSESLPTPSVESSLANDPFPSLPEQGQSLMNKEGILYESRLEISDSDKEGP